MLGTGAEDGSGIHRHYFHPELSCWLSLCFLQPNSKSFICVCVHLFHLSDSDFTRPASGKPSVGENELKTLPPWYLHWNRRTHTVFVKFWMCVLLAGPGVESAPWGAQQACHLATISVFYKGVGRVFLKQNSWPGRPTRVGRDSFLPALPH